MTAKETVLKKHPRAFIWKATDTGNWWVCDQAGYRRLGAGRRPQDAWAEAAHNMRRLPSTKRVDRG